MKKFAPIFAISLLALSGCAVPKAPEQVVTQQDQQVEEQQENLQKITIDSMQNNIQAIETLIASEQMYTYQLPIANSDITKREVSGFLNAEKTGKISKVEIGLGELIDEYYFEKGVLIFLRTTTQFTVDGKADTQIREMNFESGKLVKHIRNGESVNDTSKNLFIEEQSITEAEAILSEFSDRKLNAE